jgi:phosphoribosylanthranilate isomerase
MKHIIDISNNDLDYDIAIYTELGDIAIDLKHKETGEVLAGHYFNTDHITAALKAEVWQNGGITPDDIAMNNKIAIIKRAVIDFNYKFPCPASGIIFYEGQRITQEEFNQIAKGMK